MNIFPLLLLFLFGGYIAFYAKPFLTGWNYVFVRQPFDREAEKQATLSQKLNDSKLVDAVLQQAWKRVALTDAETANDDGPVHSREH